MKVLAVRLELCNGCGVCEATCAATYFKTPDRDKSAIRVSANTDGKYKVVFCSQCGECIAVCAPMALARLKNGLVRLRKDDCVGCLACVGFCPDAAMQVSSDEMVPIKCNACGKCVDKCPTGALYLAECEVPAPVTELTRSIRFKTGEGSHGH